MSQCQQAEVSSADKFEQGVMQTLREYRRPARLGGVSLMHYFVSARRPTSPVARFAEYLRDLIWHFAIILPMSIYWFSKHWGDSLTQLIVDGRDTSSSQLKNHTTSMLVVLIAETLMVLRGYRKVSYCTQCDFNETWQDGHFVLEERMAGIGVCNHCHQHACEADLQQQASQYDQAA